MTHPEGPQSWADKSRANTETFSDLDKDSWRNGPWHDEIDKATWVDPETDLDCMIVRNHGGALCGYVGVPKDHPLHSVDYTDPTFPTFDVHGNITFSSSCSPNSRICHVLVPGRPTDIWWVGFDCAHSSDDIPSSMHQPTNKLYRTFEYVVRQVTQLAKQVYERGPIQ